ncbi:hypothetical protein IW262DRAFT_1477053 [Armillaria fumosa]|nr:hypothetical protein IW262DRAFT_1477053 [Armillaria fumosa]
MASLSTDDSLTDTETPVILDTTPADALAVSLEGTKLQDEDKSTEQDDTPTPQPSQCPLRIYTRAQILALSKSPLVAPPMDMPELKDWFGAENEQNLNKKDHDSTPPNSARERRFRRDVDDNDASSRPSFRSTLSQPSQMGNFKHQSLRDRDGDKDRDLRDKEGQERLRNLSDKFDRDRLVLPLSNIRGKDREPVSHLGPGSSRTSGQPQLAGVAARRGEGRENGKKKAGETNEDWRRGGEPRRLGRDERSDTRGDRDERERPRSRVRDSSRSRRDPSASKRDREDRDRRDRDRDENRRDGDRDDYRRGRDRDMDRDNDDPRRWRDDGKRDERMAMRRERDRERERDRRDKPGHDQAWDSSNDRRWAPGDDRSKKATGRDRKNGIEDGKDDRRGEREREKEPAWMDTYIPTSPSTGILGGKGADGELDGIQAWKKVMKEKEQRENKADQPSEDVKDTSDQTSPPEKQLDEIQIFKMLMKREQEQKKLDQSSDVSSELQSQDKAATEGASSESSTGKTTGRGAENAHVPPSINTASTVQAVPNVTADSSVSLLSMFVSGEQSKQQSIHPDRENARTPTSSRLFPRPLNQDEAQADRSSVDPLQPQPTTVFNPPQGSRLLAFGSRAPTKPQTSTSITPNGAGTLQPQTKPSLTQLNLPSNVLPLENSKVESHRTPKSFSPFEEHDPSLSSGAAAESARRERQSILSESGPWVDSGAEGSALGQAPGKGSRFAKFFDGKTREGLTYAPKTQTPVGFMSSSPTPGQRPEGGYNGTPDLRNMDDIYAMLNNSTRVRSRCNMNPPNSAPTIGGIPFGQHTQAQLHLLQQQHLQSQSHHLQNNRLEPLYESRLDNRNFMPDGLVPGLRSAPPPRNRENGGMFSDPLDEAIHLSAQRIPPMPQRGIDHLYSGPVPYSQQAGRHTAVPLQQYRGGPSPISSQNPLASQHQRIPPGLANLGGRPPHEPNQFVGIPSVHGGLVNGPQPFTTFTPGGNLGYVGPPRAPPQQLQSTVSQHPLGGLGHPNGLDLRNANQSQLLNMGALGGSVRGMGTNVYPGQNHNAQASLHAMRQPQQHLPPHLAPHMLPHLQQQVPPNAQSADLMALLLGGQRRE